MIGSSTSSNRHSSNCFEHVVRFKSHASGLHVRRVFFPSLGPQVHVVQVTADGLSRKMIIYQTSLAERRETDGLQKSLVDRVRHYCRGSHFHIARVSIEHSVQHHCLED